MYLGLGLRGKLHSENKLSFRLSAYTTATTWQQRCVGSSLVAYNVFPKCRRQGPSGPEILPGSCSDSWVPKRRHVPAKAASIVVGTRGRENVKFLGGKKELKQNKILKSKLKEIKKWIKTATHKNHLSPFWGHCPSIWMTLWFWSPVRYAGVFAFSQACLKPWFVVSRKYKILLFSTGPFPSDDGH